LGSETDVSSENRPTKRPVVPAHPAATTLPTARLRTADAVVTAVQLVAMVVAFFGSDSVRGAVAIGCVVVFLAGATLFSWAFLIAAGRSRQEEVTVAGAFFLAGSITEDDRRWAYRFLIAQSVIGLVAASADPYTAMAFGILVPMFGLGVIAFLGSAHGVFRPHKGSK
jgi:hypothetical protein